MLKEPAVTSGVPISASEPIRKPTRLKGKKRPSPRNADSDSRPPVPWMTTPAARNKSALKDACVNRWNRPANGAPMPTPANMYPSWATVEYAMPFLKFD